MDTENLNSNEQKINALDELFFNAFEVNDGKDFNEMLQFINKFCYFSPFNAFLLYTQNQGLHIAMTRGKWSRYGRYIKPHSKAYVILVPFGPVDFVYVVLDTFGDNTFLNQIPQELYDPFFTKGEMDSYLYNRLIENASAHSIFVKEREMFNAAAGFAASGDEYFLIEINNHWGLNEKFSSLVHELAHILTGHQGTLQNSFWDSRKHLSHETKEIEAESISYLVCSRLGLKPASEKYLSTYVKNQYEFSKISLDKILTISGYIEQMLKPYFRPKK